MEHEIPFPLDWIDLSFFFFFFFFLFPPTRRSLSTRATPKKLDSLSY
jgi:hypothetical protein